MLMIFRNALKSWKIDGMKTQNQAWTSGKCPKNQPKGRYCCILGESLMKKAKPFGVTPRGERMDWKYTQSTATQLRHDTACATKKRVYQTTVRARSDIHALVDCLRVDMAALLVWCKLCARTQELPQYELNRNEECHLYCIYSENAGFPSMGSRWNKYAEISNIWSVFQLYTVERGYIKMILLYFDPTSSQPSFSNPLFAIQKSKLKAFTVPSTGTASYEVG